MKILIIEDETLVAESLIKMVKDLAPSAKITGPLTSVKESKLWLQNNPVPDLILSDIQLSDGVSLDIFTNKQTAPIIFTTAFNEYAIRAFKVNSIDYLLKPIDKKELTEALNKYYTLQQKFNNETYMQQMITLFKDFAGSKKYKERFAVHHGRNVMLVAIEQVACFVKEEVIYLVNNEGRKFITDYRSLDEVEELIDPAIFYRINRQHLVHLTFIESYGTDETGKLTLNIKNFATNEATISKDKAASFKQWYDH